MVEFEPMSMFWKAHELLSEEGAFSGLDRGIFMARFPRFVFRGSGGLSRGPESGENGVSGPAEVGSGRSNMGRGQGTEEIEAGRGRRGGARQMNARYEINVQSL